MPTTEEQINSFIVAADANTTMWQNKAAGIDTSLQSAIASLDTAKANIVADETATAASRVNVTADETAVAASKTTVDGQAAAIATAIGDINNAIVPKVPYYNLLKDGGRFVPATDDRYATSIVGVFDASRGIDVAYNGSSVADGGKFTTDNSTNGGAGVALPQTVSDLLAAMGRVGSTARYGPEFYIAKWTAGAGVTVPRQGHYLMRYSDFNTAFTGFSSFTAFGCWVRLTAGTGWIPDGGTNLRINGVLTGGDKELLVADGWVHVSGVISSSLGFFNNAAPDLYGILGTVFEIALPSMIPANIQHPIHTHPIFTLS